MKRVSTLVLSLALLAAHAAAQDSGSGKQDPSPSAARLEEMQKALEAQRKQIELLQQQAAERNEALEQMQTRVEEQQRRVQDQLKQAEAAAAAADAAARDAEAAMRQARQAPDDLNLQPAAAGVYKASLSKSMEAMLQQPNTATSMVTPPWAILKIADNVTFRFGVLAQPTYEAVQDPNSTGYSQNFYLRRIRFNVLGNLPENISIFFQTDDVRVGNSGITGQKNINSGFAVLDAWAQWNFLGHAAALQGGYFLVPSDRQILTSAGTFLALDLMTWPTQMAAILEQTSGRDYGVGLNGALLDDHLTYRTGIFEGYRAPAIPPAAGARNSLLFAGRVQYDVFDTEYVYAYPNTYLGKKKVVAVGGWYQAQNDYKGYGGDLFVDWPVNDGDGITSDTEYVHYDGHGQVFHDNGTNNTLPEQETLYTAIGYYFCRAKIQPFFRYEFLHYADPVNLAKEQDRIGGGFNYYVYGQNFKIVPYYERIYPKVQPTTAQIQDFNRFALEIQGSF